jgi:hypothetical protein
MALDGKPEDMVARAAAVRRLVGTADATPLGEMFHMDTKPANHTAASREPLGSYRS